MRAAPHVTLHARAASGSCFHGNLVVQCNASCWKMHEKPCCYHMLVLYALQNDYGQQYM